MFAVVQLNSGFMAVGEYLLAYALVALSAAVLLREELLRWWQLAVLAVSAVVLLLSYEALAHLGLVLLAITVARIVGVRGMGPAGPRGKRAVLVVLVVPSGPARLDRPVRTRVCAGRALHRPHRRLRRLDCRVRAGRRVGLGDHSRRRVGPRPEGDSPLRPGMDEPRREHAPSGEPRPGGHPFGARRRGSECHLAAGPASATTPEIREEHPALPVGRAFRARARARGHGHGHGHGHGTLDLREERGVLHESREWLRKRGRQPGGTRCRGGGRRKDDPLVAVLLKERAHAVSYTHLTLPTK